MELSNLRPAQGAKHRSAFRKGRGSGSGNGKTAGYGSKGQKARSGSPRPGFEGGQMPLYRRLPKRGFTSRNRLKYAVVSLDRLNVFEEGSTVDHKSLLTKGIVRDPRFKVKVLGNGRIEKKLTIEASAFSAAAKKKIEEYGGTCEVI